jgi:hypothetical protein
VNFRIEPFLLACLFFVPASAAAQSDCIGDDCSNDAALVLSLYTSTTVGGGITTIAAIAGGVYLTVAAADKGSAMKSYLEKNAVAVRADLSLGAGATIDDLATAYRVAEPQRGAFGKLIRENRERLLRLADTEKLDTERAQSFTRLVYMLGRNAGLIDVELKAS